MKKLIFILTFLFSACAIFAQTRITAPIVRNSSSDSLYSTHYDSLGNGGLITVYNKTSRNALPYAVRKSGMIVITNVDDSCFQLQGGISNSNWVGLSLSGSSYTAGNGINIAGSVISADTSKLVTTNSTQYITGSKTFSKYVNVLGIEVGITNVAGGSTTAMSNTSTQGWYVASGAPTTTTITLPDATTLSVGQIYTFNNDATGSLVINQYGDGTLYTAPSGGYCEVILLSNSFSSGQWDVQVWMPKNATFGTSGLSVTGTINSTGLDTYSSNLGSSYTSRTKIDKNYVDSSRTLDVKYSDTSSMLSPYQRSYSAVKYTDTSSMLSPYLRSYLGVKYSDTTSMLSGYARTGNLPSLTPYVKYTDTSSMLSPYARNYSVVKYTDTSSMLSNYRRKTTLITNSDLTNSTISGVSLGSNLSTHTNGLWVTGGTYNGSSAITWNNDTTTSGFSSYYVRKKDSSVNGGYYPYASNPKGFGTFTLPSLTAGSVLFSDGSTIAQNNSKLFWDNTNYVFTANRLSTSGNVTNSAWGTTGINFNTAAATYTDNSSATGTIASNMVNAIGIPTIAASNTSVVYTNAATLYIAGSPIAGTNVSITNPYALYVAGGYVSAQRRLMVGATPQNIINDNNTSTGHIFDVHVGTDLNFYIRAKSTFTQFGGGSDNNASYSAFAIDASTLALSGYSGGNVLVNTITDNGTDKLQVKGSIISGVAGTTLGQIKLAGSTSGTITIQPQSAAGTYTLTLPNTAGTNGYALTTDGSGNLSWSAITTPSSSFYLGTTSIALNRSSGSQSLTGISIDGNAGTVTNGAYVNVANTFTQPQTISVSSSSTTAILNGTNTGTNGGASLLVQNNGITSIGIGNYSNMLGGSYDGTPTIYGSGSIRIAPSGSTQMTVTSTGFTIASFSTTGVLTNNSSGVISSQTYSSLASSLSGNWLPLSGGTLTGALSGTSGAFTGSGSFGTSTLPTYYRLMVTGVNNAIGLGASGNGSYAQFSSNSVQAIFSSNWYYNSSDKFSQNGYAPRIVLNQSDGSLVFSTSNNGTADNTISYSNILTLAQSGAATFAGSLSGTSATFSQSLTSSNSVQVQNTNTAYNAQLRLTASQDWLIQSVGSSDANYANGLRIFDNTNGVSKFILTGGTNSSILNLNSTTVSSTGNALIRFQQDNSNKWQIQYDFNTATFNFYNFNTSNNALSFNSSSEQHLHQR
jgi:hypothetical protein